jgi:hypothetical protein
MSSETYTFLATEWDVAKALEMVEAGEILAKGPLDMDGPRKLLSMHRVNEKYAKRLTEEDLERPVIIAQQLTTLQNGEATPFSMLIDGWHRVWKARELGMDSLPAVMVDGEKIILQGLGR